MSQLSLQERLVAFLKKHPNQWFAKGQLADLAREKMGVTGESVGRRLRVLAEASDMHPLIAARTSPEHVRAKELQDGGHFEVKHLEKNHAWYRYVPPTSREVREVIVEGGVAREVTRVITTNHYG